MNRGSQHETFGKGQVSVEMTPQDVQHKTFERVKRGFDPQQVGMYLDHVAAALAARDRQLHELHTEIAALERAVVDVKENEEAFRLTMMAATQAKEEMLRQAAEAAGRIEDEARAGAELILERARVDAEDQVATVKREIENLQGERKVLERQLQDLRGGAQDPATAKPTAESAGRPSLELVVDTPHGADGSGGSGLAARVGDITG